MIEEKWEDPYKNEIQKGIRCDSMHPTIVACRCMFHRNNHPTNVPGFPNEGIYHRYTSGADGRSVSWFTEEKIYTKNYQIGPDSFTSEGIRMNNWDRVDPEFKKKVEDFLRGYLKEAAPSFREAIAKNPDGWYAGFWHFGQGMAIRNALRDAGFKDDMLPAVEYDVGGKMESMRNWDDYYVEAIEAALNPPAPSAPFNSTVPPEAVN